MPDVQVQGIRLHCPVEGNGDELVLMLHGALASGAAFRSQRIALRDHFRLAYPDLRGHGKSTHFGEPGCPWDALRIEQYVADVLDLMDHLSPDRPVHLVGVSMGGLVSAQVTANRPERVASLALLSTSGRPSERRRRFFSRPPEELPQATQRLSAMWHGEPYWRDLARALFEHFVYANHDRYPEHLAPPRALVMQAREDEILDAREWEAWVDRIDAPVEVVRPAGDHAFFADGRTGSRAANAALRAHLLQP